MSPRIRVRETRRVDLEGGYLIDGFPSVGFSSAIATESMVRTSSFAEAGIVDSEAFPPISVVRGGRPGHPTRIFVNDDLKIGVFLSYLALDQPLHRMAARAMLWWARRHKVGLIVSSVAVRSAGGEKTIGIGSTDSARKRIADAGLEVLDHGTVPGIPGVLLSEGALSGQDVIVIILHVEGDGPDYKSSARLCMAMSSLIPGASCDIPSLQKEAEAAEAVIRGADEESRHLGETGRLRDSMYR